MKEAIKMKNCNIKIIVKTICINLMIKELKFKKKNLKLFFLKIR